MTSPGIPSRSCFVSGCIRPHFARQWCHSHYDKWLRWGDPLAGPGRNSQWKIGPERLAAILADAQQSPDSLRKVAARNGLSPGRLSRLIKEAGLTPKPRGPRADGRYLTDLSSAEVEGILAAYQAGIPLQTITQQFQISTWQILSLRRRANLSHRRPKWDHKTAAQAPDSPPPIPNSSETIGKP